MSIITTSFMLAAGAPPSASNGAPFYAAFDPIAAFLIGGSALLLAGLVYGIFASGPDDVIGADVADGSADDEGAASAPADDARSADSTNLNVG
jgi:hypothetical protein